MSTLSKNENISHLVSTIDFHVTCECSQECPYCWGPQGIESPVDTETAIKIINRIKEIGAKRIVFTGGDPLERKDLGELIIYAKKNNLEVALSTTGDKLNRTFLQEAGFAIDLVSLPLDGSTEDINSKTKEKGHHAAILYSLNLLIEFPQIDVKICTPVTRFNHDDIINIVQIAEDYAEKTDARVFYNIFQAFPRSMQTVEWDEILLRNEEFIELKNKLPKPQKISINYLSHEVLDKLYLMIFPNGNLVIPKGNEFLSYRQFLDIENYENIIEKSQFDSAKHLRHSQGWEKNR